MLTKVAAMELGPSGIRVAGIGPGLVDTPLTAYQRDMPAFRQAYLDNTPLGRVGTTADVAAAALFLASTTPRGSPARRCSSTVAP
jgi:3alpha(or 20beta)-hydroxysteroid dehydrogenase